MRYDWQVFEYSRGIKMSTCIVLGKNRQCGHNRSHANNATKRVYRANIQKKTYILSNGSKVKVSISAHGIRVIDKKGVSYLETLLKEQN